MSASDKDEDWDNRRLCSDGACIGTIDLTTMKCRVCGAAYKPEDDPLGAPVPNAAAHDEHDDDEEDLDEDDEDLDEDDEDLDDDRENTNDPPDSGWDDRKLCPDGSCVGTIGENGKCRVCGLDQNEVID